MSVTQYIPLYFEPIKHPRAQEARQKGMTVEQLLELERKNQQSPGVVIEDKRDAYQNMRASVKNNPREAQRQKEGEAKAKENVAKAVNLLLAPTLPSTYVGLATGAMNIGTGEAKNTVAGLLWNDTRLLLDVAIPGIIGLGAKGTQTAVKNIKWNKFLNDWEKRNYLNKRIENNFTTKGYNYTFVPESPYKEVYNPSTKSILRVPVSESELPNVELWRDNTLIGKFKGTKEETFDIGTEGVRGGAIIDHPVKDYVADISGDRVYLGTRKKIRGVPDLIHLELRRINPTPILNGQFIPRANTHGGQEAIWWNRNRPWAESSGISQDGRILKVNELDVTPVRNLTRFDSPSFVLTEDPIPMNLVEGLDYNHIWGGYEKMVFQSPPTQRSLGKTSLTFFERPLAKLTEAERLGIPRGERNIKQHGLRLEFIPDDKINEKLAENFYRQESHELGPKLYKEPTLQELEEIKLLSDEFGTPKPNQTVFFKQSPNNLNVLIHIDDRLPLTVTNTGFKPLTASNYQGIGTIQEGTKPYIWWNRNFPYYRPSDQLIPKGHLLKIKEGSIKIQRPPYQTYDNSIVVSEGLLPYEKLKGLKWNADQSWFEREIFMPSRKESDYFKRAPEWTTFKSGGKINYLKFFKK